jgi:hypothetical protein
MCVRTISRLRGKYVEGESGDDGLTMGARCVLELFPACGGSAEYKRWHGLQARANRRQ